MNFRKRLKLSVCLSIIGILYLDGRFVGKFFNKVYQRQFSRRALKNEQEPIPADDTIMMLDRKILSNLESEEVLTLRERTSFSSVCTPKKDQPSLKGNLTIKEEIHELLEYPPDFQDSKVQNKHVQNGGKYKTCEVRPSKSNVAIIIPYRKRGKHLKILLSHLHPILQRQQINYRIFVVEQNGVDTFNKGRLYNAGFMIISSLQKFTCVIFHDVDLLTENDSNIYDCTKIKKAAKIMEGIPRNVVHFATKVDKFGYKQQEYYRPDIAVSSRNNTLTNIPLKYKKYALYGGVTGMTPKQYNYLNGYSNQYWGWGCEDEDMAIRIENANMSIIETANGRFTMIKHERDTGNGNNWERFYLLKDAAERHYRDGLSDLKFKLIHMEERSLYTHIEVNIGKSYLGSLFDDQERLVANGKQVMFINSNDIIIDEYRQFLAHFIMVAISACTLYFTLGIVEKLCKCISRIYTRSRHAQYVQL